MRTIVGVVRGGPSSEYEISLASGAAVLEALDRERYEPRDIFIDRSGQWHSRGIAAAPEKALRGIDVVFNTLHGDYGEDGRLHRILTAHGVPYTGSDAYASLLAFNKQRAREEAARRGIKIPYGKLLERDAYGDIDEAARSLFRTFPMPAIIKPIFGGSSVGMTYAPTLESLAAGLRRAFELAPAALVEEFIRGREASVGIVEDFRGQEVYALMPIEIIPPKEAPFFDYAVKYNGASREICPGNFTDEEKTALMDAARTMHEGLGLSHYSRSDFVVSKRGTYFLETNNAAGVGLTPGSLLPKALKAAGSSLPEFVDHIISLVREGRRTAPAQG